MASKSQRQYLENKTVNQYNFSYSRKRKGSVNSEICLQFTETRQKNSKKHYRLYSISCPLKLFYKFAYCSLGGLLYF